jgi:hypothetical protein
VARFQNNKLNVILLVPKLLTIYPFKTVMVVNYMSYIRTDTKYNGNQARDFMWDLGIAVAGGLPIGEPLLRLRRKRRRPAVGNRPYAAGRLLMR